MRDGLRRGRAPRAQSSDVAGCGRFGELALASPHADLQQLPAEHLRERLGRDLALEVDDGTPERESQPDRGFGHIRHGGKDSFSAIANVRKLRHSVEFSGSTRSNTGARTHDPPPGGCMLEVTPVRAFADNYIWLIRRQGTRRRRGRDPGDARPVEAALGAGSYAAGILVTHHHADHVGGVRVCCGTVRPCSGRQAKRSLRLRGLPTARG